jgi:hypothetical protein
MRRDMREEQQKEREKETDQQGRSEDNDLVDFLLSISDTNSQR